MCWMNEWIHNGTGTPACLSRQTETPLLVSQCPLVLSTVKAGEESRPRWSMFTLLDLKSKQDFQRVLKNLPNTNLRLPPHQSSLGAASGSQDKDRVARLLAPNTPTPCSPLFWCQEPPSPSVQPLGCLSDPKAFVLPITELSHMLLPGSPPPR